MTKPATRRAIQVVSHGPSCLDGVMAAAAVARFYEGQRVVTRLVANNDSDRVLQELELRTGGEDDEIWITDLSWNSTATGEHLTELVQKGARVYWIDHHRTAARQCCRPDRLHRTPQRTGRRRTPRFRSASAGYRRPHLA